MSYSQIFKSNIKSNLIVIDTFQIWLVCNVTVEKAKQKEVCKWILP